MYMYILVYVLILCKCIYMYVYMYVHVQCALCIYVHVHLTCICTYVVGCSVRVCVIHNVLQVFELDLSTVVPSLSGPKRPHDRVAVSDMKADFQQCLQNKVLCT